MGRKEVKLSELKLILKGLWIIEEMAMHHEVYEPKTRSEKDWVRVYKIAHTLRARKCRKNHPNWIEEITGVK